MTAPPESRAPAGLSAQWTLLPGIVLSALVATAAVLSATAATRLVGRPVVEALVLAIVFGMVARTAMPSAAGVTDAGVRFVGKQVLEVAVCLLGATMDVPQLFAAGAGLAVGIVALVVLALGVGLLVCRAARLPRKLAILVACGNAICGNSAIAAVAPAIGATQKDIASSIAFTAVLGVGTVFALPLLVGPLGLSDYQFGVLTGLTVYAVPQVLAASFAVSVVSGQVATVVKLARVLMLGPVVLFFTLREHARGGARPDLARILPWFIAGFVVLAAARSAGALPSSAIAVASATARWSTVAAMAALGFSVDLRTVSAAGIRTVVAGTGSLVALFLLALALIRALSIQ